MVFSTTLGKTLNEKTFCSRNWGHKCKIKHFNQKNSTSYKRKFGFSPPKLQDLPKNIFVPHHLFQKVFLKLKVRNGLNIYIYIFYQVAFPYFLSLKSWLPLNFLWKFQNGLRQHVFSNMLLHLFYNKILDVSLILFLVLRKS